MILVVLAACIAPFFIKGPSGKPLMSLSDLMTSNAPGDGESPAPATVEPRTIYKWKDEDGWHFSTEPVDVQGVETIVVNGDINIVPAVTLPVSGSSPSVATPSIPPGVTTVSPEKIQEMMGAAGELQETIDQRKADIDKAVGHP